MSQIRLKFIADRSISGAANNLAQWDANGDIAYTPADAGDWIGPPTGAKAALNELALRTTSLEWGISAENANFTATYNTVHLITGAVDVQLPPPVVGGRIKLKLLGSDDVNLLRDGSENIETVAATYVVNSTRQAIDLITDGTDWFLI